MRCENKTIVMKENRWISKNSSIATILIVINVLAFSIFNYIINIISKLPAVIRGTESAIDPDYNMFGFINIFPHFTRYSTNLLLFYLIFVLLMLGFSGIMAYKIKTSFAENELNYGQKGKARWTTKDEIKEQYKEIPLKTEFYKGKGGIIVNRQGDKLYVDNGASNNLIYGTTRSGKGEMFVVPSIDIYSRADKIENRPSLIVTDPKSELYKMSKETLEKRGYEVHFLNLDNPLYSMGYNPLKLVIDYYKSGQKEKAQMVAKSFSFQIFCSETSQEPMWQQTATDLFTALIIAVTTDCLEEDNCLNEKRRKEWIRKRNDFALLSPDEKENFYNTSWKNRDMSKDPILNDNLNFLPEDYPFELVSKHEKNISCYSCLNFFRDLCDRKALEKAENQKEREKIAETALDEYFNSRPALDYAKALYQESKTAGERAKGSVYLVMQAGLGIFSLDNIAMLTAEQSVDFEKIGYGDKPIAIFISVPSEDRSNHFLVTSFISQLYQYLFQLSKNKVGKKQGRLDRDVKFIYDEFGNSPPLDNFGSYVTVCLSTGMSFDIYVQSLNQIEDKYEKEKATIMENFATQIYIKSVGNETSDEFSDMLGTQTIVEISRNGKRLELDKNFTESSGEKPLIYAEELRRLKEGECVIYRGIKRQDKYGVAVDNYPIICEYADKLSSREKKECLREADKMDVIDEDTGEQLSISKKYKIAENKRLKRKGTALLYRWEYLTDDFPNADSVVLKEINPESRKHIDYSKLVYNPDDVVKNLDKYKEKNQSGEKGYYLLKDIDICDAILNKLKFIDKNYEDTLRITESSTLAFITQQLQKSDYDNEIVMDIITEISSY